jgi:hypothetical protein
MMVKCKKIRDRKERPKHGAPRMPNTTTRKALREARSRKNIESFASVERWAKAIRSV